MISAKLDTTRPTGPKVVSLFAHRDAFGWGPLADGSTGRGGPIRLSADAEAGGGALATGGAAAKKSKSPSTGIVMGGISASR